MFVTGERSFITHIKKQITSKSSEFLHSHVALAIHNPESTEKGWSATEFFATSNFSSEMKFYLLS